MGCWWGYHWDFPMGPMWVWMWVLETCVGLNFTPAPVPQKQVLLPSCTCKRKERESRPILQQNVKSSSRPAPSV